MLRLSSRQEEVFRMNALAQAKVRAIEFVKLNFQKSQSERNDNIEDVVDRVFEFAANFGIQKEINIQKLLGWEYIYGFINLDPIPMKWEEILTFPDRDEDVKVLYFERQIKNT